MEEIGNILPSVFRRHVRREDARVAEILASLWPRIAGKLMAEHSRPVAFACGTLTLAVTSGCWAKELQHLTEEIRARVNACMGSPVVKQVRVSCDSRLETANWKFRTGSWKSKIGDRAAPSRTEDLIKHFSATDGRNT